VSVWSFGFASIPDVESDVQILDSSNAASNRKDRDRLDRIARHTGNYELRPGFQRKYMVDLSGRST
jgi:hypothetical protein